MRFGQKDDKKKKNRKVCIQGIGFVGAAMSLAVAMARDAEGEILYDVVGVDIPDKEGRRRVDEINSGIFPFETSDIKLKESMIEATRCGNLRASTEESEYKDADIVIVDINLDILYREGEPTTKLLDFKKAIAVLGRNIKEECLVIVETTVPPGTCEKVVYPIIAEEFKRRGMDSDKVHIAHSYERVMPGEHYFDSIVNYWRVYSGLDDDSANLCEEFLKTVISTEEYPLTRLKSTTSSETAKVLENSYRATTIAFMEEWGRFAEAVGIDLFEIVDAIRMRPTHSNMRQPGFGVGGYCLTKDPYFALLASRDLFNRHDLEFPFSTLAVKYNNRMPIVSLDYIERFLGGLDGKRLLLLGVSYRQDVGDTRYSPSKIFAEAAIKRGASLTYQDPLVTEWPEMGSEVLSEIPLFNDFNAIVFAVQHRQYADLDFSRIILDEKLLIFDANKVLSDRQIEGAKKNKNIVLKCIGRGMDI